MGPLMLGGVNVEQKPRLSQKPFSLPTVQALPVFFFLGRLACLLVTLLCISLLASCRATRPPALAPSSRETKDEEKGESQLRASIQRY